LDAVLQNIHERPAAKGMDAIPEHGGYLLLAYGVADIERLEQLKQLEQSKSQHHSYVVSPADQGSRLDMFLARKLPDLTRSFLKRLIDQDLVTLNTKPTKAGVKLRKGDRIDVTVPPPEPLKAEPEAIALDILYEDESIVVVNKPAGLVVHPAAGNYTGTLVNALLGHCGSLAQEGGLLRPGIVHRLDKNTSGVLVVAKNDAAHVHLARQFQQHSITRRYWAVVLGTMTDDHGTISSLIGRHPVDRKRMSAQPRRGKGAVTHWKILKRYRFLSLLELRLETGRTHQIRVHLSGIHHPVLGDPEYGGTKLAGPIPPQRFRSYLSVMHRQALHAATLGFIHPSRQEYVEFQAPLPDDFQRLLDELDKND